MKTFFNVLIFMQLLLEYINDPAKNKKYNNNNNIQQGKRKNHNSDVNYAQFCGEKRTKRKKYHTKTQKKKK